MKLNKELAIKEMHDANVTLPSSLVSPILRLFDPLKMLKIPKLSVHEFRIGDPVWVKMNGRDSPGKVCKKS